MEIARGALKNAEMFLLLGKKDAVIGVKAEESLPLPGQSAYGYDVVAEYTDIYRRRFRSTLFLLPANQRDFDFGQVPELEE